MGIEAFYFFEYIDFPTYPSFVGMTKYCYIIIELLIQKAKTSFDRISAYSKFLARTQYEGYKQQQVDRFRLIQYCPFCHHRSQMNIPTVKMHSIIFSAVSCLIFPFPRIENPFTVDEAHLSHFLLKNMVRNLVGLPLCGDSLESNSIEHWHVQHQEGALVRIVGKFSAFQYLD